MANSTGNTDIDALNELIEIMLDSADGYETATDDAADPHLRGLFVRRGLERRQVAHDLQDYVRLLGGNAENEGSVLGRAQRYFVDLKASVAGNDNKAIVDEVERGEDQIKTRYEKALCGQELSAEGRRMVEQAFIAVRRTPDQGSALRLAAE